ncbi:hypothetical protein D3C73_921300 [compost metagenome]
MDYHYNNFSYTKAPQLQTTQLYITDGASVQYIGADGGLGKLYDLAAIIGTEGNYVVEYAAEDIFLVRPMMGTRLYAIHTSSGTSTNLSDELISSEDRKEWDRADGTDPYALTKMLVLTKREGSTMTFTYAALLDGTVKTVKYTIPTP